MKPKKKRTPQEVTKEWMESKRKKHRHQWNEDGWWWVKLTKHWERVCVTCGLIQTKSPKGNPKP